MDKHSVDLHNWHGVWCSLGDLDHKISQKVYIHQDLSDLGLKLFLENSVQISRVSCKIKNNAQEHASLM